MMRNYLLLLVAGCLFSCKGQSQDTVLLVQHPTAELSDIHEDKDTVTAVDTSSVWSEDWIVESRAIDTSVAPGSAILTKNYSQCRQAIHAKRLKFKAALGQNEDSVLQRAGTYLETALTRDVIPYWYGTIWDFNGISSKPGQGEIACGYFVSTTTLHAGFELNRYRVAQKGASDIAKTYSTDSLMLNFTDKRDLVSYVKSREDGLYVIGLDFHVGFLHKDGDKVWFIHSNYADPDVVIREEAALSPAIDASDAYVLSSAFHERELVKSWLEGDFLYPPAKK